MLFEPCTWFVGVAGDVLNTCSIENEFKEFLFSSLKELLMLLGPLTCKKSSELLPENSCFVVADGARKSSLSSPLNSELVVTFDSVVGAAANSTGVCVPRSTNGKITDYIIIFI